MIKLIPVCSLVMLTAMFVGANQTIPSKPLTTAVQVPCRAGMLDSTGQTLRTITRVSSQGNGLCAHTYHYRDEHLDNGVTHDYRLIAVDVNGGRDELGHISASPSAADGAVVEYELLQNYPNPFNPKTSIAFELAQPGFVSLIVYNLAGEVAISLLNETLDRGRHVAVLNGVRLSSGVYLYRLRVNGFVGTSKMLLLK